MGQFQKFNSSGTFLTKWGTSGSGNGQFLDPRGVVVDTSNNVHVSDPDSHQIQKFNSSGQFQVKWGSNGSAIGEFHFPYWIGVEASEYIYVVDSGNHRIQNCHSGGWTVRLCSVVVEGFGMRIRVCRFSFSFKFDVLVSGSRDFYPNLYIADRIGLILIWPARWSSMQFDVSRMLFSLL